MIGRDEVNKLIEYCRPRDNDLTVKLERLRDLLKSNVNRIWVVYNVWDDYMFWEYSLRSVLPHCDGIIVLSGPYAETAKIDDEINDRMRTVFDEIVGDTKIVHWRYKRKWESHMQKRGTLFELDCFEENDWIFIIDDDELLRVNGSLRSYLEFYTGELMRVRYHREEGLRDMVVIYERLDKIYPDAKISELPNAVAVAMTNNQWHEPEDVIFKTRLFRWQPGIQFVNNHWTWGVRQPNGIVEPLVGMIKSHDIKLIHARGLRPLFERLWLYKYYNYRSFRKEDVPAPPEFQQHGH